MLEEADKDASIPQMLEKHCAQGSVSPMTSRPCVSTDPTLDMKNKFYLLFWIHNKAQEKGRLRAEAQWKGT